MPRFLKFSLYALIVAIALTGCGLSLAEDITPPPNYRPPTTEPDQPITLRTIFPLLPPDPVAGQVIYAEKCEACHGARGMGDGPQAGNLPNPAAPIGSPDLARASRPVEWFTIVTEGNLNRFMPGFAQSLTDRQRWDVVAYAYTLSTREETLAEGRALYGEFCAACHGAGGQGDGPQAAGLSTRPASWKDQELLSVLSTHDMVDWILIGKGEMHSFADQLTEPQAYAVADFIRTLSFAGAGQAVEIAAAVEQTPAPGETPEATLEAQPAPTDQVVEGEPEPAETASTITIRGRITNATPGGTIPDGLTAELAAFQGMAPAFEQTAPVSADGSFVFDDVVYESDYVYFTRVQANGLYFNSDILHGADVQGGEADLPLEIYETTSDASLLRTDRLHVFFDFTTPGKVQVVNLYIISNPSGQVVAATEEGQPVVRFELPEGATNLQFQDGQLGERFVETENGFGDTAAVPPGQAGMNQILFAYDLPYANSLSYEMKVPMPVESAVVMLPTSGVSLRSDQLEDAGSRDLQGMSFRMYQAAGRLAAGETINLSLRGRPSASGADEDPLTMMIIGLGVFGAALVGAGFWLMRQRARERRLALAGGLALEEEDAPSEASEAILDAIVALDDQHATGGLPEAAYQERRAELKARLAQALSHENGAGEDEEQGSPPGLL